MGEPTCGEFEVIEFSQFRIPLPRKSNRISPLSTLKLNFTRCNGRLF